MVLGFLGAILFWGMSLLSVIIIIYNRFSEKVLFKKYNIINNLKITSLLNLLIFPLLAGLMFRIGQEIETTSGVHWGCYFENIMLAEFMLMFLFWILITVIFVVGLLKNKIINYQNNTKLLYSYLILLLMPIIISILNLSVVGLLSSRLNGSCL